MKKYISYLLAILIFSFTFIILPVNAAEIGAEVLLNGDFEKVITDSESADFGRPKPWSCGRGWTGDVMVETDAKGNHYVKMTRKANDTSYMSIIQTNRSVEPGATYNLQVKYKADPGTEPMVTIVYRDSNQKSLNSISINLSANGEWKTANIPFSAPYKEEEKTYYINVELRDLGKTAGSICWDDASCLKTENAPVAVLETNEKFYYTDTKTGTAILKSTGLVTLPDDAVAEFKLIGTNGTVLKESEASFYAGEASFIFPLENLTEKETYRVCYTLRHGENIIETGEETVYRYKRPSMITTEGKIQKDGKPFLPVMGYHVQTNNIEDYGYCRQVGINVIQFFPWTTNADAIKSRLDLLADEGLMAFVALYGTDENKAADVVNASKDHQATFGYMLMDEPLHNGVTEERLEKLYKAVRDNDDMHPAYVVESMAKKQKYAISAKYCDIFATDPYPGSAETAGRYPTYGVELAKEAAGQNKPVMCITQCFPLSGYEPDGEAVRNMTYQALMSGAMGIGYYDMRDSEGYKDGAEYHAWERLCWSDMKDFAEKELDFAYKAFISGEYEKLSDVKSDSVWYQIYKVGNSLRCIAINRTNTVQSVEIPLEGKYGFAKVLAGNADTYPELINDKICFSISANGALILEPSMSGLVFLAGGKETNEMQNGRLTAQYSMYGTETMDFNTVMVLYKDEDFAEIENIKISDTCTVNVGEVASVSLSMDISDIKERYIKVFVWKKGLMPIELAFNLGDRRK